MLITVGWSMPCQDVALADWRRWAASVARSKGTIREAVAAPVGSQGLVGVSGKRTGQGKVGRVRGRTSSTCTPCVRR
jgi:hypothetical protein